MNLWVKYKGQLAMLAVALIFFACVDESSILGYKNPPKFNVSYIELPVTSSVLLFDSIRTSNSSYTGEFNRMLVGKVADPKFGDISSTAYTQYFTNSNIKVDTGNVRFMFATMTLKFDLHAYAPSDAPTDQTISIYEVDDEMLQIRLVRDSARYFGNYYSTTNLALKPSPIGTKTFSINPVQFKDYLASTSLKDTVITITFPLDGEFGDRILQSALKYRDAENLADSAFVRYPDFIKEFKGIAIVPTSGDKMYGFSQDANSRISIYYETDVRDSVYFNLTFTSTTGYNKITAERGATELAGLTQKYQDYYPASGSRYIQPSTGVFTKLDFSSYLEFTDTIPNMIVNSAELSIGGVETGGLLTPPTNIALRILKNNNRLYKANAEIEQTLLDNAFYAGSINAETLTSQYGISVDKDSAFSVIADSRASYFSLAYNEEEHTYNGFMTMFMQQLFYKRENKTRFRNFVLYPQSPPYNKTVNRVVFPSDNIKLKIYYTRPIKDNL